MEIGIIGTGRMARALGARWAEAGHQLFFGSRDGQRATQAAAEVGHGARGGSQAEAAAFGSVVLLAVPWYAFTDVAPVIAPLVRDKVVIDCINPLQSSGGLALGHKRSAGEEIANELYPAHVVKAFNHIYWTQFADPVFGGVSADAFYCSNFDDAKAVVAQLATEMGFNPVDAGPIKHARYLEPLAVLWMQLAFHMHHGTDVAFKLIGRS